MIVSIVLAKTASTQIVTRGVGDCKIFYLQISVGREGGTRQAHERWDGGRDGRLEWVEGTFNMLLVRWRGVLEFIPQVSLGAGRSRATVLLKLVHS